MINMKYRAVPASLFCQLHVLKSPSWMWWQRCLAIWVLWAENTKCVPMMCSGMLNKAETLKSTNWQKYGKVANLNQMWECVNSSHHSLLWFENEIEGVRMVWEWVRGSENGGRMWERESYCAGSRRKGRVSDRWRKWSACASVSHQKCAPAVCCTSVHHLCVTPVVCTTSMHQLCVAPVCTTCGVTPVCTTVEKS